MRPVKKERSASNTIPEKGSLEERKGAQGKRSGEEVCSWLSAVFEGSETAPAATEQNGAQKDRSGGKQAKQELASAGRVETETGVAKDGNGRNPQVSQVW